ncbi:hypothetical protein PUN28_018546 [Cardiocondyla obscurior]|uniref:Uncharacterized protein n=1 Tax=Cardiocondyla obscurior TaxID=286306 RepID=A0AAW2EGF2_9HYME
MGIIDPPQRSLLVSTLYSRTCVRACPLRLPFLFIRPAFSLSLSSRPSLYAKSSLRRRPSAIASYGNARAQNILRSAAETSQEIENAFPRSSYVLHIYDDIICVCTKVSHSHTLIDLGHISCTAVRRI